MFKQFNVHHFDKSHGSVKKGLHRGFTAVVRPAHEAGKAALHIAYCSANDPFCRKEGVDAALANKPTVVPMRHVAYELERAASQCATDIGWYFRNARDAGSRDFDYVFKYMV